MHSSISMFIYICTLSPMKNSVKDFADSVLTRLHWTSSSININLWKLLLPFCSSIISRYSWLWSRHFKMLLFFLSSLHVHLVFIILSVPWNQCFFWYFFHEQFASEQFWYLKTDTSADNAQDQSPWTPTEEDSSTVALAKFPLDKVQAFSYYFCGWMLGGAQGCGPSLIKERPRQCKWLLQWAGMTFHNPFLNNL